MSTKLSDRLPIPKLLLSLSESGVWPRTEEEVRRQNLEMLVPQSRVQEFAPEESAIFLYPIEPWIAVKDQPGWNDSPSAALHHIDQDKAVVVADFGLGSDTGVVLDYRVAGPPKVLRLLWLDTDSTAPTSNRWVELADTFDDFARMLGLA